MSNHVNNRVINPYQVTNLSFKYVRTATRLFFLLPAALSSTDDGEHTVFETGAIGFGDRTGTLLL